MKKQVIPICEVVRLSGRTRQAIYKAVAANRLTNADLFGRQAVVKDKKLKAYLKNGNGNGNKRSR